MVQVDQHARRVVAGGFSTGGLLALMTAAAPHRNDIDAVFVINSPTHLKDIKARMAPARGFWNELLDTFKIDGTRWESVETSPENPQINYDRIYIKGVNELDGLFSAVRRSIKHVKAPTLIVHGDNDPVVNLRSSEWIHDHLGAEDKTLETVVRDRHVIVRDDGCEEVFEKVADFIKRVTG